MLCFATNNENKIKEVRALLGPDFQLLGLGEIGCTEDLKEDQPTLEGNSFQKAEYIFKTFGVSCFADDTGLEVEALKGEPGVFSARYAGPQRSAADNITLLLSKLKNTSHRKAQFRTVITLITKEYTRQFEGIITGNIIEEERGKEGFGYDPVFVPEGYSKTFAEMSLQEKNVLSHRAIAIQKLVNFLRESKENT